jgi:hypothetical protein
VLKLEKEKMEIEFPCTEKLELQVELLQWKVNDKDRQSNNEPFECPCSPIF